jgi:hypothetical protein
MEHNKASGMDGFLAESYQTFRGAIKTDLLHLLTSFMPDN